MNLLFDNINIFKKTHVYKKLKDIELRHWIKRIRKD